MMQTDLFKQLDLNIDAATRIYWWQHFVAQVMLVGVFLVVATGVIIWYRRRQKIQTDTLVQQLINVLHESVQQLNNGQSSEAAVLLTISAVLKRYTAWLVHDSSICGMTDQEWLVFIKNIDCFRDVLVDCEQLVAALDRYKFAGQTPERAHISALFESAYTIMAKACTGSIPGYAGYLSARLKRDET